MSYNTKYHGSFNDNVNFDTIDIYIKQNGYAGAIEELMLDSNPVVITYTEKDFDAQIFGCGCTINLINASTNFFRYDSLFSTPERNIYIEIIKSSNNLDSSIYLFQGYILPQMYTTTLEKNIRVTISANDRLSTLDRYTPWIFVDTSTYRAPEYQNAFDIISAILYDADVTKTIAVNNTLENINYLIEDSSGTIFNNIWFNATNFESEEETEDDKKCLEKILKPFTSRCYYSNGKFVIERIADMGITPDKRFSIYTGLDTSVFVQNVSNNRIDLSCTEQNKMISKSAKLTFNPGYQKIVLELKYKKPESLIENYFYDIEPLDGSNMSIGYYPLPKLRQWMVSDKSLLTTVGNYSWFNWPDVSLWTYPSEKIPGIDYATYWIFGDALATTEQTYNWAKTQVLSSSFEFTPGVTNNIVTINYKVAIDRYQGPESGNSVNSAFALRVNDVDGADWWLAKSNESDSSVYWRNSVYTFNSSIAWDDLLADQEDPNATYYIWDVTQKVDMTEALDKEPSTFSYRTKVHVNNGWWFYPFIEANPRDIWVTKTYVTPYEPQFIGIMYLDMYMTQVTMTSVLPLLANYHPYPTYIGDIDVDIQTPEYDSILEASMGYYYEILDKDIEIFDVSTVNYTNGVYNMDASLILRNIFAWRESMNVDYLTLQEQYIQDMSQIVSVPRYNLNIEVISNDSSIWTLGDIYTHNAIRKDGSLMEFMCNGLIYNVKDNAYRLNLMEYVRDDNWRIIKTTPNFSVDETKLDFNYTGISIDNDILVTTSLSSWSVSSSENWIDYSINGNTVTALIDYNYGVERDGSLWFIPTGNMSLSSQVVSIHQDSSDNVIIEFTADGSILLSGIGDQMIDISIYAYSEATADSAFGETKVANARIDFINDDPGLIMVNATALANDPGENDFESDEGWNVEYGVTDASKCEISYSMTDLYTGIDGFKSASGYVKIVGAIITGTSNDVSIRYNKWAIDEFGTKTKSYE